MSNQIIKLGDIIINPIYQLRKETPDFHVRRYSESMRNGDVFPPIILNKKTNELLDGFTRYTSYKKVFKDPEYAVPIEYKSFKTEKEKFMFIAEQNCKHGNPYGTWEKKNIVRQLQENGASLDEISNVLGIRISKITKEFGRVFVTIDGRKNKNKNKNINIKIKNDKKTKTKLPKIKTVNVNGRKEILKRGLEHLENKKISEEQWDFIFNSADGWSESYHIKYLLKILDMNIFNKSLSLEYLKLKDKIEEIFD